MRAAIWRAVKVSTDRERAIACARPRQHDTFERLVIFAKNKIAEAFAHFGLDGSQLPVDLVHISAPRTVNLVSICG